MAGAEREVQIAAEIAEYLRGRAEQLPVESNLRGLAIRSASHWSGIAEQRHRALLGPEELRRQRRVA